MVEKSQVEIRTIKLVSTLLLLFLAVRVAADAILRHRWVQDPTLVAVLGWLPLVLAMPVFVLVLVIIRSWDMATRYGPRLKVLTWSLLAFYILIDFVIRLGLTDWVDAQGRTEATIIYATLSLVMLTVLILLPVLAVKDLEERTKRDVEAKLHDHATEAGQTTLSSAIGHQPH